MKRRRTLTGRVLSFILVFAMMFGAAPAAFTGGYTGIVNAAIDSTKAETITGKYTFASNESQLGEKVATDTFVYSDRLFTESSYEVNRHLATLSALTAMTTASYYTDTKERDHASNSKNIKALLKDYGFTDIETNKYYSLEKEEDSMGCIVGRKTITVGANKYTLLAVLPRSAGYKQEWVGNLTVGTGGLHQGFKAARDEILRFVKGYISSKKISGDLKVWITGHSRGGAVTNLLGGFFAEGGGGYFDGVKIDPEDVYCYPFATPETIRTGVATRKEALSVAGYRGNENSRYKNDSQGEAYTYSGADAGEIIQPHTGVYRCIKNCAPDYDIITLLPPNKWGYDWYGVDLPIKDGKAETKNRMKEDLKTYATYAYNDYTKDGGAGDEDNFAWKTFDFATMSFVDDTAASKTLGPISQGRLFTERVNEGLARRANDVDGYVKGGYQETLRSLAGIYGMNIFAFIDAFKEDKTYAIKAGLFCYLSYAKDELKAADPGLSDDEAIARVVEQLVEFITGKDIIPGTMTVDGFFEMFVQYLVDNAESYEVEIYEGDDPSKYDDAKKITIKKLKFKSKAAQEAFEAIANKLITSIPKDYQSYIPFLISGYDKNQPIDSEKNKAAIGNYVFSTFCQCAYGKSGKKDNPNPDEAKAARMSLYAMLSMFLGSGDFKEILNAMGKKDGTSTVDGHALAKDFLRELIKYATTETETDADGKKKIIVDYKGVDEAAEGYLSTLIEKGKQAILDSGFYDKGSVYYEDVIRHCETLKKHVRDLRHLFTDLLFYEKGKTLKVSDNIRMASTLISQAPSKVAIAHYNELYLSWMRAQDTPWDLPSYALSVPEVYTTAVMSKGQMKLSWDKAEDATDYVIAYREAGKEWTTKSTKGKTSYTLKKMKQLGLYEFKVMAVYKKGTKEVKGDWSEISYRFFARTGQTLTSSKKSITVRVNRKSKASGYEFIYATDKALSKNRVVKKTTGAGKTKITIKGLKVKKIYYVRTRPYRKYKGNIYLGVLNDVKRIRVKK